MLSYQNLEAWKKGMQIVKEIYLICKLFPSAEVYALTSQMKRAPYQLFQTLQKGWEEIIKRIQLNISRGSLDELETLLNVAKMVDYTKDENVLQCVILIEEEKKILNGLIKSFELRSDLK